MSTRCEHHGRLETAVPLTHPLPQCPHDATVYVHGYLHGRALPCCDECAARLRADLATVTTTPIT